jgi:hypothetical protein
MSEAHTSASLFLYYVPSLSLIFSLSSPPLLLHLPCSVHRRNLQSMVSALWRPHHLRPGLLSTRSARPCPLRRRSSEGAPRSLSCRGRNRGEWAQPPSSSSRHAFVTGRVLERCEISKILKVFVWFEVLPTLNLNASFSLKFCTNKPKLQKPKFKLWFIMWVGSFWI